MNLNIGDLMAAPRNYHHGNLKEAFLKAARDLMERDGLGGLSLRKCAEKVGVSHAAPKNHFGNMAGLLTAVVTTGYAELAVMMTADANTNADRKRRRDQALLGYVDFAQANPALYDLMSSRDRLVLGDPDLLEQIRACFVILADCSTDLGWHHGSLEDKAGKGQVAIWSLVHDYAQLVTAGHFKKDNMKGLSILDILPIIQQDDQN